MAGKIKPKVAARDRRRARSAQLPPECQNPPWCAIMYVGYKVRYLGYNQLTVKAVRFELLDTGKMP